VTMVDANNDGKIAMDQFVRALFGPWRDSELCVRAHACMYVRGDVYCRACGAGTRQIG
jgi:hypothetical protein